MKTLLRLWTMHAACAAAVWAQPPVSMLSPEIHPDHSVTFQFRDPNARDVSLNLEGAPPLPMRRGGDGVWTARTGVLAPDYYGYSFLADGVSLADPNNAGAMRTSLLYLSNWVHVPGPASLSWEWNEVPRGIVHHHFYRSAIAGDQRDFYVYTPPGYDPAAAARYPVLYLLHGFSDDASGWTVAGRANVIFDNLIARGRAQPMLVVMPLAYGTWDIFAPGALEDPPVRELNYVRFGEILLGEIVPQVEAHYRVRTERAARAIAGLSMGGGESAHIGLQHLEAFAWIGSFSAPVVSADCDAAFPGLDASANARIRLLWIACGRDDPRLETNRKLGAWLTAKGVRHVAVETPGAHTWMVWRRNLTAFAPLLFREK